jgi:hypothetical protein
VVSGRERKNTKIKEPPVPDTTYKSLKKPKGEGLMLSLKQQVKNRWL